jgi:spermidine synthase
MSEPGLIYFNDGKLIAEAGSAKVYKMNDELFLEIGPGHTLWALESELDDYKVQLYDYPKGRCLEIGLGLGTASRYILTFPLVEHLTTVEINPDVIAAHELIREEDRKYSLNYNPKKHLILCANGIEYAYQTRKRYDFIFIDCYDRIDEDTLPLIADMFAACRRILKPSGRIVMWLDKHTPEPYYTKFERIKDTY